MKRILCTVMSIMVAFSMLCMISGCNQKNDQELIVGSWVYEVEGAENFNKGLKKGMGEEFEEIMEYFEADSLKMRMIVTYKEDGTYSREIDEDTVDELMSRFREIVRNGFEKYFESIIDQIGTDMSVDAFLEMSNISLDDLVDGMFTQENTDELLEGLAEKQTGRYKLEDGKIYWTEGEDEEFNEDSYDTYKLEDDTLTLLECFCKKEHTITSDNYPVVCNRIKE